ncbi:MAG: acyl-CoA thioesterase [Anaerolineae bacterium]|nr:acyl-CoA thioesterase [Anaerolineae bacterium]
MFSYPIQIRFRDMDAFNHVNNAVYHSYLEEGRIQFMRHLGIQRQPGSGLGWILVRTEIDFRGQARYGDDLVIEVKLSRMGNRSFELHHRITRPNDQSLIVEAKSVQACMDYDAGKSIAIPDDWREKLRVES